MTQNIQINSYTLAHNAFRLIHINILKQETRIKTVTILQRSQYVGTNTHTYIIFTIGIRLKTKQYTT